MTSIDTRVSGTTNEPEKSAAEVRTAFLEFFQKRGHTVVPSAPLIPPNDPTLMFTNAGMVQFKDVFTGKEARPYSRAASSQKCIRISGKHNDLENVGVTARHHTFFEMLGNFSFGDYFKEEAIASAWELLTKGYGLPADRMCVTVFGGDASVPGIGADDEARTIWKKVTGFSDDRIIGMGAKDNFWSMGEIGPCGPCTEIHFHLGGKADLATFDQEPTADGKGWMEIWNNVFMQFERSLDNGVAKLEKLPRPCVDTGMGLERIASVVQGKVTNYDGDLLRALVSKAASLAGKPYGGTLSNDDISMRVIADHARTTAFLLAEGVSPDRGGRPYVLRRVMRRAIRHGHRLGITQPFLHDVAMEVVALMGDHYPDLVARRDYIASVAKREEIGFRETIDRGLKILDDEIATVRARRESVIPGDSAFRLYDTYGFPLDLTEVIASERGLTVDETGYKKALEEQQKLGKGSKVGEEALDDVWRLALARVVNSNPEGVRFTGYEHEQGDTTVVALVQDGQLKERVEGAGRVAVITDTTPFYAESGGQVGDRGRIASRGVVGALFNVDDTLRPVAGLIVHHGVVENGALAVGDRVHLEVDRARRTATRRNHSATHLLHWALRSVLGEASTQKGSLVGPDRLRFDFSHDKPVTHDELARIEDLVNAKILENAPVESEVLSMEGARKKGAMAIFGDKYGDVVRVLTMTTDSVELCGGTHARALGEIGLFKILSEGGVAGGVRRIEATTGLNSLVYVRGIERIETDAARILGCAPEQLVARVDKIRDDKKALEREVADLKRKLAFGGSGGMAANAGGGIDDLARGARDIPGGKVLAVKVEIGDAAMLRELAEKLRDKLGDAVVLLGSVAGGKASLVLTVSKSLTAKYKAGELIKKAAAAVGGSGGGRPDMAQAGGTLVDKIDEALETVYASVI
jgi:alanyl-tRNA synthetase